jgi:hypothetical protein
MVLFALTKATVAQQLDVSVDVGNITELRGNTRVVRDKPYESALAFSINSMDTLETANGRMGITFRDDSVIRLTEHSNVTIDSFIFNADPNKGELALNFLKGTGRFITGTKGRISKDNIKIRTHAASIAIRGTDFTITVSETGEALIILLPDEFGNSSGEIEVSTALGEVLLTKPYEATTVYNFETPPTPSVILNLTLDMIDNMLIVNPPETKKLVVTESTVAADNMLDVDFLQFEELDQDDLAEDSLEYQELDIDHLSGNFLEDLLDVLQDIDALSKAERTLSADGVTGTTVGYDKDTQISTFATAANLTFLRQIEDALQIKVPKDGSYSIRIEQEGKVNQLSINGGTSSIINIKQGS